MTTDLVADACVAAKWVLAEADSADATRALADTVAAGGLVFVLDHAETEVANVLRTRVRQKKLTVAEAEAAYAKFQALPYRPLLGRPFLPSAFALALKYQLAVYDALFVAAVRHLGCDGVTADEPLVNAVWADFPRIKLLRRW